MAQSFRGDGGAASCVRRHDRRPLLKARLRSLIEPRHRLAHMTVRPDREHMPMCAQHGEHVARVRHHVPERRLAVHCFSV